MQPPVATDPVPTTASGARRTLRSRLSERFSGVPLEMLLLALITGVGGGLGAIVFRELIAGFTWLFTGHAEFGGAGHQVNPWLPWLGVGFVVLAPVVGGLLYGPLVNHFAKEARGHGVPEVMLAVAAQGGRIRPQVVIIKALASAICLGSGGSVGREGPIAQIGAALGSVVGQRRRLPASKLRLLVGCGAAAGISATFNTPIGGAFFGLELILQDFELGSFGLVVIASIVANLVGIAAFGRTAFLPLPSFQLASYLEYLLYAGLGLIAGVVGVVFTNVLYGLEGLFDRWWKPRPEWLRPAAGGLLLGVVLLALPQLYGVGYPAIQQAMRGDFVVWFLLLLLAGKILATSLTIAIGGSGGVFAPSLFMGAMLGTAYGDVVHHLWPTHTAPPAAYGLVGMGAVFAGAARAPITTVILLFELTGVYGILPPLLFAIVVAAAISSLLSPDTIYTRKLRRRGIDLMSRRRSSSLQQLTVRDAMDPVPATVRADAPLDAVVARLARSSGEVLPVVEADGTFVGIITPQEVERALRDNRRELKARELASKVPALSPDQSLEEVVAPLVQEEQNGLPVVSPDGHRIIGWITHRDVLRSYQYFEETGLTRRTAPPGSIAPATVKSPEQSHAGFRIVDIDAGKAGLAGQRLGTLAWPPFALVLHVRRGNQELEPDEQLQLEPNDRLQLLVAAPFLGQLFHRLSSSPTTLRKTPPAEPSTLH